MSFTDISSVRELSGLTKDEISDTKLGTIIEYTDKEIVRGLHVRVKEENLTEGSSKVSDTVFYTTYKPIADSNADGVIDKKDITVWKRIDNDRTEVTVSDVNPELGKIVLSSPHNSADMLIIDYQYYKGNSIPDSDLMKEAASYKAAFLAMIRLKGKVPTKYSIGRMRVTDEIPGVNFRDRSREVLRKVKQQMVS